MSPVVAACGVSGGTTARPAPASRHRYFAPIHVSADRVTRTVVGLRPFRPAGFVLRADSVDGRVIVHDYGHGGGGITLSWGCAHLAAEEALATGARRFAVIGCGVIGLTTAILLQRQGADVTIFAKALPPATTSNVAGAQWSPFSVYDDAAVSPAFRDRFRTAARLAYREFQNYVGPRYGVRWIDNLYLSDTGDALPPMVTDLPEVFPGARATAPRDHPFEAASAATVTTMFVEPNIFLPALIYDFRVMGGSIVVREFHDLPDLLTLSEPVIMNCTGLGSRDLFGDVDLVPVKGQMAVLQPQYDVDYLLLTRGLYMFPRSDGILLGGTFERGEWSLEPDRAAERRIIAGHTRLFAPLLRTG
jgi:glycine/D-amino acid oxidase-like deaminating enzyme